VVKNGGRVMKNVTGYDIAKLTAGSFGTLAALTDVTFKVLPIPERSVTLILPGLSDEDARAVMSRGLGSPYEVNAAAHLPAAAAAASGVPMLTALGTSATLLRIEGFSDSLTYRLEAIRPDLETDAPIEVAEGADSEAIWQAVRDVHPFAEPADRAVWRVSTAPTEGPGLAAAIAREIDATAFYDWGGGLVWLSVAPEVEDAGTAIIRAATQKVGGHATMIRGPEALRRAGQAMPPVDPVIARLSARLKESFDPDRILNPGRL
jgi:glycolate oxidase FAD binding subunit